MRGTKMLARALGLPPEHPLRREVASVSASGTIGYNFVAGPRLSWTWKNRDHVEDKDPYSVRVTRGDEQLLLRRGWLSEVYNEDDGCGSCEPISWGYLRFDDGMRDASVPLDAAPADADAADAADAADVL